MPNDIDTLMTRVEAINALSPEELSPTDIDTLIAYHRADRERKASGKKYTPQQKADVKDILAMVIPPKAPLPKGSVRRI